MRASWLLEKGSWKMRVAATYLGAWILLLVVVIYGPVLIGALADPSTALKVEGLNYFADTLLFGGVILSLARAMAAIAPPSAKFTESVRNSSLRAV
jgi:ABC-type transport system involved in multi-copper enzyme maturation permease subunit